MSVIADSDLLKEFNQKILKRNLIQLSSNKISRIDYTHPQTQKYLLYLQLNPQDECISRKYADIRLHADWMHKEILGGKAAKILDLGCGPGFYSYYLATKGHHCVGMDISPLAINHAKGITANKGMACEFVQGDMLTTPFKDHYNLVIMPYSDFNEFEEEEAKKLLIKIADCLAPNGSFYCEVLAFQKPEKDYMTHWFSSQNENLFCAEPHLCFSEQFWLAENNIISHRIYVLNFITGTLSQFIRQQKLYTDEQYRALLLASGFHTVSFPEHPPGTHKGDDKAYISIVASKK